MNLSSLERKTVRPGSLADYSYYHSDRHKLHEDAVNSVVPKPKRSRRPILYAFAVLALIAVPLILSASNSSSTKSSSTSGSSSSLLATSAAANKCSGNKLSQDVVISVSARHMWVCKFNSTLYNSAVVTGITTHPDTITPIGNYAVFSKITNTTLTGSDSTGVWSDPVNYWMPFLNNQYGTYGFHDATWRANSEFGKISPNSAKASHGCVELPLASAKWLYNWISVGTNVSIIN